MGSEFLAREDLENIMTLVFSGFSIILHLAHHSANFRRFLGKSFLSIIVTVLVANVSGSRGTPPPHTHTHTHLCNKKQ